MRQHRKHADLRLPADELVVLLESKSGVAYEPPPTHPHAALLSSAEAIREAYADSRDANFSCRVRMCQRRQWG